MQRKNLPLLALRDLVIFPHMVTHFDAGREQSVIAIEKAEEMGGEIFLVTQREAEEENPGIEDLYTTGTVGAIKQVLRLPGGIYRVLVEGRYRGVLKEIYPVEDYFEASIEVQEEDENFFEEDIEMEALINLVEENVGEYIRKNNRLFPDLLDSVIDDSTPGKLVDTASGYIDLKIEDSQRVLDTVPIRERLLVLHEILSREIQYLDIQNNIEDKVKNQINESQKEYFLKEQIRAIHDELGEEKSEEDVINEYRARLEKKELPDEVREKAEKELKKLSRMNIASPDYPGITMYLDWILDLPWCESSDEDVDIKYARKVLDDEHYGLKEVKERILEFIALRKKSENSKGPILCLVGPPGVGKTSIGRSIANALSKEYVRMSLGGVTDESEIRGHRRTYIGSMPGRVITLMKEAGEKNPLFLIDEVDKVGRDFRGDPSSALLEVLDPAQNDSFTDRYMELPFDLSDVFFITTANVTKTIPSPLLDRMEVIEIGGYTAEEKFHIAKDYLIPRNFHEANIQEGEITISDGAIETIIEYYTREAGVRALNKEISKVVRKAILELYEKDKTKISINNRNLSKYLGEKRYLHTQVEEHDRVGLVNGLAWTEVGGESLSIEANLSPGKGKLKLTGQLGDVMKESAEAALTYLWSRAEDFGIDIKMKENYDIHIHVPEGAVPKDGPSAGISMATAMYSVLTKKPVSRHVAMTGEINLRGNVLPIGGLKEKLLAAQRMGIEKVLIPIENERDLKEIDSPSLRKLKIVPVAIMDDVLKEAFHED